MKTPSEYFNDGLQARYDGLPASACPLIFKAWPEASWQLGWQFGDINLAVASGKVEQEPLQRLLKRPFDQGQIAFMQGVSFQDCPYEITSPDGYNWQAGWIAGDQNDNNTITQGWNFPVIALYLALTLVVIIGLVWAYYS